MKRIVYFLLIMILAVSLVFVSCDNEPENNDTNDNESSENTDNNDNNGSGDSGDNNGDNSGDNGGEPGEPDVVIDPDDLFRVYSDTLYLEYEVKILPSEIVIPSTIDGLSFTKIYDNLFEDKDTIVSVTIPDSVTSIGKKCFAGCTSLKSISAKGVTSIGSSAFAGCSALKSASFDSLEQISMSAFEGCTSLESTSFPKVTLVAESAFSGCTSLVSIKFPEITSFSGKYAFSGCTKLYSIYISSEVHSNPGYACSMQNGSETFKDCTSLKKIFVPSDSVDNFKNATSSWGVYANLIYQLPTT
ncbi:MAG TPA: hypothetical protein DCP98_00685 [Sphaerochaeta sp.]|nr:hypothetical protein [Sphaerochaeta sp.]